MKEVLVIVNPASQGGRTASKWMAVQERLRAAGLDFEAALTTRPGEATDIARGAVRHSRPLVVAAGGDGTINEVVNGFFESGELIATQSRLGVLPLGTGGDFRRTFSIPDDPLDAVDILTHGKPRRIDAGTVAFRAHSGTAQVRHFVNIADAGIAGEVVKRVNRSTKRFGGTATFMLASVASLLRWRNQPLQVTVDGERRDFMGQQVVVANGRYYGAGMKVAPRAEPDDGLFDVLLVGDVTILQNVRGLSSVRRGAHLDKLAGNYELLQGKKVSVDSPARVLVDVDGEQPGTVPATFEIVPSALTVMTPGP